MCVEVTSTVAPWLQKDTREGGGQIVRPIALVQALLHRSLVNCSNNCRSIHVLNLLSNIMFLVCYQISCARRRQKDSA